MKKIISLLSVFAMIATMFTTVAMADENNYLDAEILQHDAETLKIRLYLQTNQTINSSQAKFDLNTIAKENNLTASDVSFTKLSANTCSAVTGSTKLPAVKNVLAYTYANTDGITGRIDLMEVTFNVKNVTTFALPLKTALSVKANGGVDLTSMFDNRVTGLKIGPKAAENTVTSFTMTPDTKTLKGGEKADFTVAIEGTGSFDGFDYKVVNGAGTDVTADVTTLAGKVITFTAPEATDADQTFTITATSTVDTTKTATSTVTVSKKETPVFAPAAGGNMVNPANGKTEKTYLTDIVKFNTDETAPSITIKDEAGETKTFDGNWYPTNLKGQGTINVLVIVRYAGETEKTFSIVNE